MQVYSYHKNPYLKMYLTEYGSGSMAMPFSQEAPPVNPEFTKSFVAGAEQQYQQQKDFSDTEIQKYQKVIEKLKPFIEKSAKIVGEIDHWLHQNGIPKQLAVQLIAAFLFGGLGAVPVAALNFAALKYAGIAVEKGFEAGSQAYGKFLQSNVSQQLQPESLCFSVYCQSRMYQENLWSDAGSALGKAAGYVAGKVAKWTGAAANLFNKILSGLKAQATAIKNFAMNHKIEVAKAATITALAILIGAGVGVTYKTLTNPETVGPISKAVIDSGLGSMTEMQTLFKDIASGTVNQAVHALDHASHVAHAAGEFGANLTKKASAEAGVAMGTGALTGLAVAGR